MTIKDVERRLNDGIERTEDEHRRCIQWLTEFMTANDMSLKEIDDLCFQDSNWVFEQIY